MPAITPVPTTRVSDLLIRQRLTAQLRFDQREIYNVQAALASGRRLSLPSDEAPSALRAISLQSLLERKEQVRVNLETGNSFLTNTDTALSQVSHLLAEARGLAVSAAGSTSSAAQRAAAATEIDGAIRELFDVGNQQFRDRYLFAGTETSVIPLADEGGFIRFDGNEGRLESFSDLGVLFSTNLHAQEVFGVLSDAVRGNVDLSPRLTASTLLSDLRGGRGISLGAIEVSDGTNSAIIDLGGAVTVGELEEILEQPNLLPGRLLSVELTDGGINIALDALGGGNLTIRDVGLGTTATELGIVQTQGAFGIGPVLGEDLDPRLTLTTRLADLQGIPATATLVSAGANNDIALEANSRGTLANVTVTLVAGATAGNEVATYDSGTNTLQITIQNGVSTANQVIAAINREGTFSARWSSAEANNNGTGVVQTTASDPSATATTALVLGLAAGLRITNGHETFDIDLSAAETIQDVLNLLNGSPASVLATINESGTGIDVRSRLSGADFGIGELHGRLATFLGLRSLTGATRLDELNHRIGVRSIEGPDFRITRRDGVTLDIDVSGAQTVQEVIDLINGHPANFPLDTHAVGKVRAELAPSGNGIDLVTIDPATTADLTVTRLNNSSAASDLGLLAVGVDVSPAATLVDGAYRLSGTDPAPVEVEGIFNALLRLRDALVDGDHVEIQRAYGLLDDASERVVFARSAVGARQQGLEVVGQRLEDERIELSEAVSNEIDTDYAAAISEFTARQISYEAALRATAEVYNLTLLNYL